MESRLDDDIQIIGDEYEDVYILDEKEVKSDKDKDLFHNLVNSIKAQKKDRKYPTSDGGDIIIIDNEENIASMDKKEKECALRLEEAIRSITPKEELVNEECGWREEIMCISAKEEKVIQNNTEKAPNKMWTEMLQKWRNGGSELNTNNQDEDVIMVSSQRTEKAKTEKESTNNQDEDVIMFSAQHTEKAKTEKETTNNQDKDVFMVSAQHTEKATTEKETTMAALWTNAMEIEKAVETLTATIKTVSKESNEEVDPQNLQVSVVDHILNTNANTETKPKDNGTVNKEEQNTETIDEKEDLKKLMMMAVFDMAVTDVKPMIPLDNNKPSKNEFHKCEECEFLSKSKKVMEEHEKSIHSGEVRFRCSKCDFKSYFKFNVAAHQIELHSNEEIKSIGIGCKKCENGESHIQCDFIKPKNEPDNSEETKAQCEECEYTVKDTVTLNIHVRAVHKREVRYACGACVYKSFYKHYVGRHQKHMHKDEKTRIIGIGCEQCEDGEVHTICDFAKPGISLEKENAKKEKQVEKKEKLDGKKATEPKIFSCALCPFETSIKSYQSNHQKFVHAPNADLSKVINCSECEFQNVNSTSMEHHNRAQHLKETRFNCSMCEFKSFYSHHVMQHIKYNHKDQEAKVKRIECPYCRSDTEHGKCAVNFDKKPRAKSNSMKMKKKLPCNDCDYKSTKQKYLQGHQMLAHGSEAIPEQSILRCNECEFECGIKRTLHTHKKSMHEKEVKYACSECIYKTYFKQSVVAHVERSHPTTSAAWTSIGSNYTGKSESGDTVKSKQNLQCTLCLFETFSKSYMNSHEKLVHSPNADLSKILNCPLCEFQTMNTASLSGHKKAQHLNEKRFMCSGCGFKSFYNHHIRQHIKTRHRNERAVPKKITCPYCRLNTEHTECTPVEEQIKTEENHTETEENHTESTMNERKCDQCDHISSSLDKLQKHKRGRHEGIMRYSCSVCTYSAFTRMSCKTHIKNVHSDSDAQIVNLNCEKCKSGKEHKRCYEDAGNDIEHFCDDQNCDFVGGSDLSVRRHTEAIHRNKRNKGIKIFSCGECDFKSYESNSVKSHVMMQHKGEDVKIEENMDTGFKCDECDYMGPDKSVKRHKEAVHEGVTRFVCSLCQYKAYEKQSVKLHATKNHVGIVVKIIDLSCDDCKLGVEHDHTIKTRKNGKWQTRHFECEYCPFKSNTTQGVVVNHMKEKHPSEKLFQCDSCPYKCNWLPNLKTHKAAKHEGAKFTCHICGWKTGWKPPFYEHLRGMHGIFQRNSKYREDLELTEILCDLCGFTAKSKRSMRLHKKSKCSLRDNTQITTNRYKTIYGENRPVDKKDNQVDQKDTGESMPGNEFNCAFCEKFASNPKALAQHIAVVHQKKYRSCTQCGFQASSFYHLNTHKYEKHQTGQTNCSVCGLKVKNRFNLLIHMKLKHPSSGLKCDLCDHKATSTMLLKKHKDTSHLGLSFPCDQCDYKGPGKAQLHMHRMRLHAENYLQCVDCNLRAESFVQLKAHRTEKHNSTPNVKDAEAPKPELDPTDYPNINIVRVP